MKNLAICLVATLSLLWSCSKESYTTQPDAQLQTTADTLHFDTLFTSTGSTSQLLKVVNNNDKGIRITSIQLAGGASSPFRINVNGSPGPQVAGIDVSSRDSVYVFVTVTIDPTTTDLPFVVRDSISINYNGNRKWVQLEAFGQNARFLRNAIISGNQTWNSDRPYVILGGLTVAPNATLTINAGCRIYAHADAPILINGTLKAIGDTAESKRILFTGDRLDEPYRNFPASFPGLVFSETSMGNELRYVTIKNAYQAVVCLDPASSGTKLKLEETIIDNAYDAGLLGINTSISARNVLISNCGKNLMLVKGGQYVFTHCTVASVSTPYITHKDPVLAISNFLEGGTPPFVRNLDAQFQNCIFWGESGGLVNSEVIALKQGSGPYNVSFQNVLWRVPGDPAHVTVTGNNIKDQSPLFDTLNASSRVFSFRLKEGSPAINKGANLGVPLDLDGKQRPVGLPDLGAYERQ